MKKAVAAVLLTAVLFVGVFIGYSVVLGSRVIVKTENETLKLSPLVTKPSEATDKETKVNINTADKTELMGLPGIGESLADRIIEYREKYGEFESLLEITAIEGIGEKKYEAISEYIKIK